MTYDMIVPVLLTDRCSYSVMPYEVPKTSYSCFDMELTTVFTNAF